MNIIQRGIITLLKSAVTGDTLPLPEGFDIEAALPLIKRHHMVTAVYDGALRCGIPRQNPAMQQLFQKYCGALLVSEGQMRDIQRVFAAFDENDIDYLPLKGCNMKVLYPKPELRLMGDADVLIRMEQYERIVPIMERLGFCAKDDTDHEFVWTSASLYMELHKRLIPSYNKDFYAYFGDGWELAKYKAGNRYTMSAEDEFVYLFSHFAKHYRDGGIGCRYVVDLWVYLRAHPQIDEAYVKEELGKLRLLEFYENIRCLITVWFDDAQTDDKTEFLTDFIFASGSWGKDETRVLSRTVRDAKHAAPGVSGRLLYIWQTAFPGVNVLRNKYAVLKKAPCLLPLIWIVRPFYKVLFERNSLKRQERNLEALSQENLAERQQLLNYVGLDYNF